MRSRFCIGNRNGTCVECTAGQYTDTGSQTRCKGTACASGKYQDEEGQASCKDTGAGYYAVGGPEMLGETTTGNGRTGRKQCIEGTRCKDGKSYKCPSGEYVDEVGQERNACLKITDGLKYAHGYGSDTFVDHKHREWPIPAVKRNDASACVDGHQCDNGHKEACAKGKYSDSSTSYKCTTCVANMGYYCPGGTKQLVIEKKGYYSPDAVTVRPCRPGHFCKADANGAIVSTRCPNGKYSDREEESECKKVDPGHFGVTDEKSDSSDMYTGSGRQQMCPRGYKCGNEATGALNHPVACVAGKYHALQGQDAADDCIDCAVGKYSLLEAS